jgi:hypothetical protein
MTIQQKPLQQGATRVSRVRQENNIDIRIATAEAGQ